MDEEDSFEESVHEVMIPIQPWSWTALAVDLARIPLGFAHGIAIAASAVFESLNGIHTSLTAHYNFQREQEAFREEVASDLEQLS